MDTQAWSLGPIFVEPRGEFSMVNIHGRLYALAGRRNGTGSLPEEYHVDGMMLREDLGGWDVVPDLVFKPFFNNYVAIPYNV